MEKEIRQEEKTGLSRILKSDIFSNLLPGEKQDVLGHVGITMLRKRGLLFSPGKKAEHVYLLQKGAVRIFKPRESGGDNEIARFTSGDIIGDFDFARGAEYDAVAEALEDSSLIMFPGSGLTLEAFALEAPHVVSKILLNSAAIVTARIKSTRKLILESASWVQELHRRIHEDPGTGLWKRSFLTDGINQLLEEPMALIMLKPDRFKILVDSNGHNAGDEAMVLIAAVLKNITRKLGRGWALRFKSNETGILVSKCDASKAAFIARSLSETIASLPPVPLRNAPRGKENFAFSGTLAWGIWPGDNESWDSLLEGTYSLLLETSRAGGNTIVRYKKESP